MQTVNSHYMLIPLFFYALLFENSMHKFIRMKNKITVKNIARAAIIAALYAALTILLAPISFGAVQFRVSECLTVLPLFFPEAAVSLFIGCLISNLVTMNVFDIVFGSLATLAAAILTSKCNRHTLRGRLLAPIPPVVINAIVIGMVITFTSSGGEPSAFLLPINMLTVGIGQILSCYGIGLPLIYLLNRRNLKNNP